MTASGAMASGAPPRTRAGVPLDLKRLHLNGNVIFGMRCCKQQPGNNSDSFGSGSDALPHGFCNRGAILYDGSY